MGGRRNAYKDRQLAVAFFYAHFGVAFSYGHQSGLHRQPSCHPCGNVNFIVQCDKLARRLANGEELGIPCSPLQAGCFS